MWFLIAYCESHQSWAVIDRAEGNARWAHVTLRSSNFVTWHRYPERFRRIVHADSLSHYGLTVEDVLCAS